MVQTPGDFRSERLNIAQSTGFDVNLENAQRSNQELVLWV